MKVGFLGGIFPERIKDDIYLKSKGLIQYAADAFQKAIIKGLYENQVDLTIINLPYIGSYPLRYKDLKSDEFEFSNYQGSKDVNVGFNNLMMYKYYSRYRNSKRALKKWLSSGGRNLIIYSIHTPFILAATALKKIYPDLRICIIVPDLPEYMDDNGLIKTFFKKIEKQILDKAFLKVDTFVVLSDYMVEPLKIGEKPWIRIEGIYEEKLEEKVEKENSRVIFYSGTLARRYGILNLLQAFSEIDKNNYQLWICGEGDAKEEVEKMAKVDSRVKFLKQLPREQVVEIQKKATVLINPRSSKEEFTKYSFPSKTIEYLASGTPAILFRLPGIPDEYFDYCYVAESEERLSETILHVCEKDDKELLDFGLKAKKFILENKVAKIQVEKLVNMLKK